MVFLGFTSCSPVSQWSLVPTMVQWAPGSVVLVGAATAGCGSGIGVLIPGSTRPSPRGSAGTGTVLVPAAAGSAPPASSWAVPAPPGVPGGVLLQLTATAGTGVPIPSNSAQTPRSSVESPPLARPHQELATSSTVASRAAARGHSPLSRLSAPAARGDLAPDLVPSVLSADAGGSSWL